MEKFKVQDRDPSNSVVHIFLVEDTDEEGYRTVYLFLNGNPVKYGYWNPRIHPTFQAWIDYLCRPGILQVIEE